MFGTRTRSSQNDGRFALDWLATASIVCIVAGFAFSGCATTNKDGATDARGAAQSELDVLRQLGEKGILAFVQSTLRPANDAAEDEEFAKDLGFTSAEEMSHAQLGSPLRIWSVPLDRLRTFQPGDDPNNLLVDTRLVLFPVVVNGRTLSSITVQDDTESGQGWRVAQKGAPNLVQKIQQQSPPPSSFLVSIAPLGLRFLGDRKEGQFVLFAIYPDKRLNLEPGDERPAQKVFVDLSPIAKDAYEEKYLKGRPIKP